MGKDITFWHAERGKDGNLQWTEYEKLDPVEETKKLKPAERAGRFATSDAVDGVSDDRALTTAEIEMLEVVNHHLLGLQSFHSRAIEAMSEEIARTASASTLTEMFDEIKSDFASGLEKLKTNFAHKHRELLKNLVQARRDLVNFKRKNEIDRQRADYPESRYAHFFWIFVALAIEGGANAGFFPQNLGLLGGFVTAVGVSAVNVAVSFLIGFLFIRNLNHLQITRKLLGALGLLFSLPLITFLHLTVAHYREAVIRGQDVNVFGVVPQVWSDPFGIQDMESMMLVLIGGVVSIIAIYKGYTFDDRYPGFGAEYRKWNDIMEEVSDHLEDTKHRAHDLYSVTVKKTLAIPKLLRSREVPLKVIDGKVNAYFSCFETYYEQTEQTAHSIVVGFRQAIQQVLEDQNRFPVDMDVIRTALRDTDPRSERKNIEVLMTKTLTSLEAEINGFDSQKELMLKELKQELDQFLESIDSFRGDNEKLVDEWLVTREEAAHGE